MAGGLWWKECLVREGDENKKGVKHGFNFVEGTIDCVEEHERVAAVLERGVKE